MRTAFRSLLGLAVVSALAFPSDAWAGPTSRKMDRQIDLFERVVDEMLVDSPNWLVRGRNNARGSYVDGHGLMVTFDATLVNWDHGYHDSGWKWWKKGRRVYVIDEDDWEDEDEDREARDERRSSHDKWFEHEMKKQERLYGRGKTEIIDVILDFGEFMSTLKDTDYLEIEAFLGSAGYFIEKDLNTLTMKVKMSDVRAFSDGKMDEKALISKIETVES